MSVVNAIYQQMRGTTKATEGGSSPESEVSNFYAGASILITGGTDLLGKCLLEKLLRACPDLERVYLLVCVRETEDLREKYRAIFNDDVFNTLRQVDPNFTSKVQPVVGDLTREDLGLSAAERELIVGRVHFIFHNGAVRGLSERPALTLQTNVLGTRRMLELGQECTNLRAFVHISTIFSHADKDVVVEEVFYEAPADLKAVEDMIVADTAPSGLTREALSMLLGKWPNVYTFSEAVAEELVQRQAVRSTFVSCVFRPSTVISTYQEPSPGWCDKKNGPASFLVKVAMGAIHVAYDVRHPVDVVPADLAINAMLVCARDAVNRWKTGSDAFVYNFGTSKEKPITMAQIKEKIMSVPNALVSSKSIRVPYVILVTNIFVYLFLRTILDFIPALIIDLLTFLHGQTPKAWTLVRQSMGIMCRLRRFAGDNWFVRMRKTLTAVDQLNARDRDLFFCDVRRLDWTEYFLTYWRGIRRHVLEETLDNSAGGCRRCCCKCPCKCPCKGACLALVFVFAAVAYFSIKVLLF